MGLARLLSGQLLRIAALVIVLALPLILLEGGFNPQRTSAEPASCTGAFLDDSLTVTFAEGSATSGPPGTLFSIIVIFGFQGGYAAEGQAGTQALQVVEAIWDWNFDDDPHNRVGFTEFDDGSESTIFEPPPPVLINAAVPLDATPGSYPIAACYSVSGEGTFWTYGMFEGFAGEIESSQIEFLVTEPPPTEVPDSTNTPTPNDEDESADENDEQADEADEQLIVTPAPTSTPEPTPTLIALATNTPVPPTPIPPTEVPPTSLPLILGAQTSTPGPQVTATSQPQPTTAPASPTSAPAPTSTSGPAPPSPTSPPPPSPTLPASDVLGTLDRPEIFRIVPSPNQVSGDIDVILTNLGLAGFTMMLVFATAVVFNQTINDNQDSIEAALAGLLAPFAAIKGGVQGLADNFGFIKTLGWPLIVLGLTAGVYGFLEPGFGFNEKSVIVVASLLLAAGAITYLTDGVEVFIANQVYGENAAVRIFPLAIVIAAISVMISRVSSFEPGVIYGFVALAVYLRPHNLTAAQEGRSVWIPSLLLLCLSVACWLALIPIRDAIDGGNSSFLVAFLEGVTVAVFIGGLEGLFFNMLPLSFMDGEKVYRWNKLIWALTMGTVALLFWHVLLNSEREYFDALSETTPMVALIIGGICLGSTVIVWLFFKLKQRSA
ncbi:MAG: hypothetical protein GEU75_04695 [Dehalococcoidia bacterium]|nr:hypothetical protein [Dehalococcoidia bacterium]